jgi:hypothetical protein
VPEALGGQARRRFWPTAAQRIDQPAARVASRKSAADISAWNSAADITFREPAATVAHACSLGGAPSATADGLCRGKGALARRRADLVTIIAAFFFAV